MQEVVSTEANTSNPEVKPSGEQVEQKVNENTETADNKPDANAQRFAALAKKERKVFEHKRQAKAELAAREAELSKRESVLKDYEETKSLLQTRPNEGLKRLGTDYNSMTQRMLADGSPTPEVLKEDLNRNIAALKEEIAEQKAWFESQRLEDRKREEQRILNGHRESVLSEAKSSPDEYELINMFGQGETAVEMVKLHWQKTGRILTNKEALTILEKDLRQQGKKLLTSKVFKDLVVPQTIQKTGKEEPKFTSLNKQKTITNELTSNAPSMLPAHTENDRMRRALEKL